MLTALITNRLTRENEGSELIDTGRLQGQTWLPVEVVLMVLASEQNETPRASKMRQYLIAFDPRKYCAK